jgi:flagellar hook capping protein FlgD
VLVDPNFTIQNMTTMTPDGRQLFGYGQMLTPPYAKRAFRITLDVTAGVSAPATAPAVMLAVPQPNPSSSVTQLDFSLAAATKVQLAVFDAAGRRVATLVDGELPAGPHAASWAGRADGGERAPAGVYFARLITPLGSVARRIVRAN